MSPPGGGSRLQKLLKLIDGGPSLETRKAAARQIAGIAASHPAQLPSVITQVAVHLKHRDWDARVAAAHCLGLLAEHFAHPSVADLCGEAGVDVRQLDTVKPEPAAAGVPEEDVAGPGTLRFDTFNVGKVLEQGTSLLASWGEEFDEAQNGGSNLSMQRQNLKKRLGLGGPMDAFVDTSDMIQDEDLLAVAPAPKRGSKRQGSAGGGSKRGASPVAPPQKDAQQLLADMSGLSARERAAALRRAKSGLKRGPSSVPSAELGSPTKKPKVAGGAGAVVAEAAGPPAEGVAVAGDGSEAAAEGVGLSAEHEWQELLAGRWPFQTLCDQLCLDVLHPLWEVRHGAAMALREILMTHAAAAGVHAPLAADPSGWAVAGGTGKRALGHVSGFDAAAAYTSNLSWVEDCAIHLVCVLALDRFGDFLSDQVVAPVRETAAQALGAATRPLPPATLGALLSSLRQLSECCEWEVRHGGLLGLKYVLAARGGAAAGDGGSSSSGGIGSGSEAGAAVELLQAVLPAALVGLKDKDDDVRAVAAEALLPVAPQLALEASPAAHAVRQTLWDILLTLEDLSPATASVMMLLARMYSSLGNRGAASASTLFEVKPEPTEPVMTELGGSCGADVAYAIKQEASSAYGTSPGVQLGLAASAQQQLGGMVPRLWPFLRHGLTSVRLAAVRCLAALLRASRGLLAGAELVRALRLVFQNLLLERNEEVLAESQVAWKLLLRSRTSQQLRSDLQAAPGSAAPGAPAVGSVGAGCDVLGALCQLAAAPTGATLAPALLLAVPAPAGKGSSASLGPSPRKGVADLPSAAAVGGQQQDSLVVGGDAEPGAVARMRLAAARALGQLTQALHSPDGSPNPMLPHVLSCLRAATASGRLVGALTTTAWAQEAQQSAAEQQQPEAAAVAETGPGAVGAAALPHELQQVLLPVLLELLSAPAPGAQAPYAELAPAYAQLRSQAQAVVARGTAAGVPLTLPQPVDVLSSEGALALAAQVPTVAPSDLDLGRQALQGTAAMVQSSEALLHTSVCAALAAAVVQLGTLPAKLNSVIQPLMAAVRREPEPLLQDQAAVGLARLCLLCAPRTPCPNDKVIKNLCAFACGDPAATPSAAQPPVLDEEDGGEGGPGPSTSKASKDKNGTAAPDGQQDLNAQALALARRGGEATLQELACAGGPALLATLPRLWDQMTTPLTTLALAAVQQHQTGPAPATATAQQQQQVAPPQPQTEPEQQQPPAASSLPTVSLVDPAALQPAVNALHVLGVVGPAVHADLLPHVLALLPLISLCSQHPNAALKLAAACCFAALAAAHTQPVMPHLLRLLTPLMAGGAPESSRVGALLAARQLIRALGLRLVPYVLLLVVPLIGRMSDASPLARGLASACFASVVALVPLMDRTLSPPPGLDEAQLASWRQEGGFLAQLLDNSAADDYQLPIPINGTLRRYQQEGINWLAFLRRFGLHGVLADDMGLGKTLQATSIIAATMFEQRQKYAQTGLPADAPRPSLIVCPSTLVAHWPYEIHKFVGQEGPGGLRVLQYQGTPGERAALRCQLAAHDVVVMAYESVRADIDWISGVEWGYCVLDEGHTIRNPASKITQACKRVRAQHRIILSGTPIQNNVLELWSLFDFLMPGFLGSERQFNAKFGKAVQTAKATVSKRGASSAAAGVLALEGLHRQVMPFVLRRTKDQVLKDLPPKIIQDVLCEPSPLQKALYEDFAQGQVVQQISGVVQGGNLGDAAQPDKAPHVFSALLYLRKLCSHPLLVLDPKQPQHLRALAAAVGHPPAPRAGASAGGVDLEWARGQLHSHLCHAPKLLALQELLLDCGIGREPGTRGDANGIGGVSTGDESSSAGHRVLVFAQLKAVLDLVETDVLTPLGVSSLRIDGGVDSAERFRRVQQFNADPTIDVMLLTTQVGGLGLNLTAADTVIFLEHDWNPMKDLQAMDRAHRLGQQRVVNVYRLLVRGTLEEQILSLQRFKLDVAATLVNQDNVSLAAMDTSHLLDLFAAQEAKQQAQPQKAGGEEGGAPSKGKKSGLQAMLDSLGDMSQNEEQYAQEFSLASFQSRMAKSDT